MFVLTWEKALYVFLENLVASFQNLVCADSGVKDFIPRLIRFERTIDFCPFWGSIYLVKSDKSIE